MSDLWNPELFSRAWNFATAAHQGQSYGGPVAGMRIPYINHIGSVTMEVSLALARSPGRYDADLAIQAALLHDVVEDTEYTFEEVAGLFGARVADAVAALSKDPSISGKQDQMTDSLVRIKQRPEEVWMVKLADRITNLYHPPFYWNAEKILSYRDEAQVIYDELSAGNEGLAERLLGKIRSYAAFAVERK